MRRKRFSVIKMGFAEICGPGGRLALPDVLREISNYQGWDSLDQLRANIEKWATTARAGDVMCTRVTAIVCRGNR